MRYYLICILVALIAPVFLALAANRTIVTVDLPYTITSDSVAAYDTFFVAGRITSATHGILITGANALVMGQGGDDTLEYNTGEGDLRYGVKVQGESADNVKLQGFTVLESSKLGDSAHGIWIESGDMCQVYDMNSHVKGPQSHALASDEDVYQLDVNGGTYTSSADSFVNRCAHDGAVIRLYAKDTTTAGWTYNVRIRGITIDSTPCEGIVAQYRVMIDSNTFYGNAHNDRYDYPSGAACWSAENPYSVLIYYMMDSSTISHNTFRSRDSYEGSRGIMLTQTVLATAEDPILIHDNDMIVNNGPGDYFGDNNPSVGIRLRYGSKHIHIYNNSITCSVDCQAGTSHISPRARPMWISGINEQPDGVGFMTYCSLWNNIVTVVADSTAGCTTQVGGAFQMAMRGDSSLHNASFNNHWAGNFGALYLGASNYGAAGWRSYSDTFNWTDPHWRDPSNYKGMIGIGYADVACTNNVIQDPIILNLGTDSLVDHRSGQNARSELSWLRTCTVIVKGSDSSPIANAHVVIVDTNDVTVTSKTTDINGQIFDTLLYRYDEWVNDTKTDTNFNWHIITVSKDADTTIDTVQVDWDVGYFYEVLTGTEEDWVMIRGGIIRGGIIR